VILCVIYLTKKKFHLPLKLSLLRASRPKSARASPPTMYSECSRFHPDNHFRFGGVIADASSQITRTECFDKLMT